MPTDSGSSAFKVCTGCGMQWATRESFLAEPHITFVGYQAFVQDGVLGLFLFNHELCGTTLSLSASVFLDFRAGPVYEQSAHRSGRTNDYCLAVSSGDECPPECECEFVQAVIETVSGDRAKGST